MLNNIKEKLLQIPKLSGVYIFRDIKNDVIYIGKAINLFNRVNSYFNKSFDIKTKILVKKIRNIEYFITNNEIEALLLENNLIKKFQPKYNIKLKDAKTYPMLKIINEEIPRIIKVREKYNNNDQYFGPFVNVQAINLLQKIFSEVLMIRPCYKKFKKPYNNSPCLNYHINKCSAPCAGKISIAEYMNSIKMAEEILNGNTKKVIKILKEKMDNYSKALEFELAAKTRDKIKILEEYENTQFIDTQSHDDSDYIGFHSDFYNACVSLIQQRNGKIVDKKNFRMTNFFDYTTVLKDFMNTYYLNTDNLPGRIFIQEDFEDRDILINAIQERFNLEVQIIKPVDQKDKKLVILAKENAEVYFEEEQFKLEKIHALRELKKILNLSKLPRIIEGFDIATLNGKYNTASMVSFIDGKPNKQGYRQFNIVDRSHPDDYSMMEEVVARRYQRLKNEKKTLPDLILIDGGKGQVNAASKILSILDLDINLIGLAKKDEYIYMKNNTKPLILDKKSEALKLLQKIRDEAHRFSNTRLNRRYTKRNLESELLKIKGLGKKRINLIFKKFGSIKSLINAEIDQIAQIDGVGDVLAQMIFDNIHNIEKD